MLRSDGFRCQSLNDDDDEFHIQVVFVVSYRVESGDGYTPPIKRHDGCTIDLLSIYIVHSMLSSAKKF